MNKSTLLLLLNLPGILQKQCQSSLLYTYLREEAPWPSLFLAKNYIHHTYIGFSQKLTLKSRAVCRTCWWSRRFGDGDSSFFWKNVLSAMAIRQTFERKCFRRRRFSNLLKGSAFGNDDSPNFWKKVLPATAIRQPFERMCFRRWRFSNLFKESAFGDGDTSIFWKNLLSATEIRQSFERMYFRRWRFVNLLEECAFGIGDSSIFWKSAFVDSD